MQTLTIGPEHGSLALHTGVEGKAAKAGHRLTILVSDWSAQVSFEGSEPISVSLRAAVASLEIVSGEGGLKPLSDRDKRSVKSSAMETLSADTYPELTFTSESVTARDGGYELAGQAELCGASGPVRASLQVRRGDGTATVETSVPLVQTAFGLKPYRGMMGTLKVSDEVEVHLLVTVPDPS